MIFCLMLKTARSYFHSSRQNTGTWRTDGWTDRRTDGRQNSSGYYSEQCGRAV